MRSTIVKWRLGFIFPSVVLLQACTITPLLDQISSSFATSGWNCHPATKAVAASLVSAYNDWKVAYDGRDPEQIASLYTIDAFLYSEEDAFAAQNRSQVLLHYRASASRNARAHVLLTNSSGYWSICGDFAIHGGEYSFYGVNSPSAAKPVRYSMTWRKVRGKWLIWSHFSGAIP